MSSHPTVVAASEYRKKHPESRGKMLLMKRNDDGTYIVTGHRDKTEHEENMSKYCCCHPTELRGHE